MMAILAGTVVAATEPGTGFEVERYEVAIRPALDSGAVSVRETIAAQIVASDTKALVFSPNALTIEEARVDGEAVIVRMADDAIVVPLPRAMAAGVRVEVRLEMHGLPKGGMQVTPTGLANGYFGCDWMVCLQDSPGDKADLVLDLFLPAGVRSVGVGKLEETLRSTDGLVLHRWRSVRPTSPYLFAFAAGDFPATSVRTSAGTLVYHDATGKQADLASAFAETRAIAAFLAVKSGSPLPDGVYDQVLLPGSAAQETERFSLIGVTELDAEKQDPEAAWVIVHEMAHQWWGNLVTTATWRDFWLNEGFATFMTAAWKQHRFGQAAYQRELDRLRGRREQLKERGYDKPLAWGGKYPSLGVRRAVQYSKGALFLATLRVEVGDTAFWNGVREYTRAHAGRTVVSRDFQVAMERASGRDLGPLFREWVYGE